MENPGAYADRKVDQYATAAAQIQQSPKMDRVQKNNGIISNGFNKKPNYYPSETEYSSAPPNPEGQRKWDRDGSRMTNQWPAHHYTEGQVGNATRSQYRGQDLSSEKGMEQDMEIGYEDRPSTLTLETLEKKFFDEKMKLAKEESDAEDAENVRHRESKIEIRKQFEERLSVLLSLQAKQREEFLYKETQERLYQYHHHQQQRVQNNYPTDTTALDHRGYGPNHHPTDTIDPRGYGPNHHPTDTIDPRGYGPNHHPTDTNDPRGYGPYHHPTDTIDPRGYGPYHHPTDTIDPRGYDPNHHPTDTMDPRGYGPNRYPTVASPADPRGYSGPAAIESRSSLEVYRERSPYNQVQRNQPQAEGRVPVPKGRSYNNTRARNL